MTGVSSRHGWAALGVAIAAAAFIAPAVGQQARPATKQAQPAKKQAPPPAAKTTRPVAAPTGAGGAEPKLLGQYGIWGAYTATAAGKRVCFALARPSSSQTNPANRPRDPVHAFISTRPAERVKDEFSINIGYSFKPATEASVDIGQARFAMYTQGDGAWLKNAAEEVRLIEAMRRGSDAVIRGVSARGTQTTDTFSLKGLGQALDRIAMECR